VMTGYFHPEVEAQARRLGVDAFVPKPVPLWELARLVQGWAVSVAPKARSRSPATAPSPCD
jgi:CheY-like chemotaxis protein